MADAFPTRRERETAQLRRTAAAAAAAAVLLLTLALMGWMLARVVEHPGVPRETGELPSWFTGAPPVAGGQARPAVAAGASREAGAAHGHEAGAAKAAPAEGDYTDFASGRVEISLKEYVMKPGRLRTRPGKVTFVLRNDGRFAHNFHVEGPGVDAHAEKFSPGRTIRLEAALQEGEYRISCPLSNHDERGMRGTLLVTSKLGGG
jgi:plastocyanin